MKPCILNCILHHHPHASAFSQACQVITVSLIQTPELYKCSANLWWWVAAVAAAVVVVVVIALVLVYLPHTFHCIPFLPFSIVITSHFPRHFIYSPSLPTSTAFTTACSSLLILSHLILLVIAFSPYPLCLLSTYHLSHCPQFL
jgi:hypothetical protein